MLSSSSNYHSIICGSGSAASIVRNAYALWEISRHLMNADYLNFCTTMGLNLSHKNFGSIGFFSENMEKIHSYRGCDVIWLRETIVKLMKRNNLTIYNANDNTTTTTTTTKITRREKLQHYQLTNAILATIVTVSDLLKLADVINWEVADYNCLPETFYEPLWEHIDKCTLYKRCNKRQWLMKHHVRFTGVHICCLLRNRLVGKSVELMSLYARFVDWSTVNYAHLGISVIRHFRASMDERRFNETVRDPVVIREFLDIIDWTIMRVAFGDLDEIYHGGAINVPNPTQAIYIAERLASPPSAVAPTQNYMGIWASMPEQLQQYYTRFPTLWLNYLRWGRLKSI